MSLQTGNTCMLTTQNRVLALKIWGYKSRIFRPDLVYISVYDVSIWRYVSKSVSGNNCDWRTIVLPTKLAISVKLLHTGVNKVPYEVQATPLLGRFLLSLQTAQVSCWQGRMEKKNPLPELTQIQAGLEQLVSNPLTLLCNLQTWFWKKTSGLSHYCLALIVLGTKRIVSQNFSGDFHLLGELAPSECPRHVNMSPSVRAPFKMAKISYPNTALTILWGPEL